jgi:hypothetical protein
LSRVGASLALCQGRARSPVLNAKAAARVHRTTPAAMVVHAFRITVTW